MPFKIEEEFEVQAPVERVWQYLITPAKVVICIPGAELLESEDERTFLGAVKVKVGPMTMSYKGLMKFTEVDEQAHQVRLVGEGREAGGAGSARVAMLSRVTPLASGSAQVVVQAEVDLVGKIVQFGRGMIEEVSKQLFRQFAACVKQHLEIADEPQAPPPQPGETQANTNAPADDPKVDKPKAVSAVPLLLHALRSLIARFFMRLFGRQPG
jgi:carbon monoxide dehydrogenase subunit G